MRMPKIDRELAFEAWCDENDVPDPTDDDIARFDAELEALAEQWVADNAG